MRRSKKRTLSRLRKTREVKFLIDVRTYDQLSYHAGENSMVGKFEAMVEEETLRMMDQLGMKYPHKRNSSAFYVANRINLT